MLDNSDTCLSNLMINEKHHIHIDGSYLEGGGQILRIALGLALITKQDVTITNIRKKRKVPGLQQQHLYNTLSLSTIFNCIINGAAIKSEKLTLSNKLNNDIYFKEIYEIDLKGAGSIGLVIQQHLPLLLLFNSKDKPVTYIIKGGTLVSFSPSVYYLNDVLFPLFKNLYKVDVSLNLIKNGLFPIGNGQVEFTVKSQIKEFSEITLTERGKINKVHVRAHYTSNISNDIITPLLKETKKILKENGFEYKDNLYESEKEDDEVENKTKLNKKITLEFSENKIFFNKGYTYSIEIILYYENTIVYLEEKESDKKEILKATLLDLKRKILTNFEDVLINENICLDEYTLDHLIIYMALANGKSTIRTNKLSLHSETALYVASQFLNIAYEVKELENNGIELTIQRNN